MKKATIFDGIYGFLIFLMILIQGFSLLANGDDPTMWAARAGIAQAFFACLTLFATIFMYKRQNEMTRRQINLELYGKRYKLYKQVLEFVEKVNKIQCPNKNDVFEYETFKEPLVVKELENIINDFCAESWKCRFLLPEGIKSYIETLINNANKYVDSLNAPINNEDWEGYVKRTSEARIPFIHKQNEIYEKFYSVLDFTKI